MTPRLTLDAQVRRARTAIRVLHRVAKYRLSRDKSASWIADVIEAQERTIDILRFTAKHQATIRQAVNAKLDAIRDIEKDARVQVVLDAFPGAELADVREIDEP